MLQLLLAVIKLIIVSLLTIATITFTVVAIARWRRKRSFYLFAGIATVTAVMTWTVWSFGIFSAESTDRDELVEAFHSNFGFDPPASVEEIKVRNVTIYDSDGHWMSFTYDPQVFERILVHDQPLEVAYANTSEFNTIVQEAYANQKNAPDWAVSPVGRTSKIFFKKDFLDHSFSEYYLWVDSTEAMVHLQVGYFD